MEVSLVRIERRLLVVRRVCRLCQMTSLQLLRPVMAHSAVENVLATNADLPMTGVKRQHRYILDLTALLPYRNSVTLTVFHTVVHDVAVCTIIQCFRRLTLLVVCQRGDTV